MLTIRSPHRQAGALQCYPVSLVLPSILLPDVASAPDLEFVVWRPQIPEENGPARSPENDQRETNRIVGLEIIAKLEAVLEIEPAKLLRLPASKGRAQR
jgi:hypothetical protein